MVGLSVPSWSLGSQSLQGPSRAENTAQSTRKGMRTLQAQLYNTGFLGSFRKNSRNDFLREKSSAISKLSARAAAGSTCACRFLRQSIRNLVQPLDYLVHERYTGVFIEFTLQSGRTKQDKQIQGTEK